MACCVAAEILWFLTRKFARKESATFICALAVTALGIVAAQLDILNYAMLSRAMIMQLFMLAGYLFRRHEEQLKAIRWPWIALMGAV